MQKQYASFFIGDNLFGIDVLLVREINQNIEITYVDPSPDFVVGLMNLRGQIVTVIDIGIRFGLGKQNVTQETCCMVLKTDDEIEKICGQGINVEHTTKDIVGLLVDRIGNMITVDINDIEPQPANIGGVNGKYLSGIIKLENNLLATLKLSKILKN